MPGSLEKLQVDNFRCLHQVELEPSPGVNLIVGENASGKTSLLEAIFVLGRGRSFRTADRQRLMSNGVGEYTILGDVTTGSRSQRIGIRGLPRATGNPYRRSGRQPALRSWGIACRLRRSTRRSTSWSRRGRSGGADSWIGARFTWINPLSKSGSAIARRCGSAMRCCNSRRFLSSAPGRKSWPVPAKRLPACEAGFWMRWPNRWPGSESNCWIQRSRSVFAAAGARIPILPAALAAQPRSRYGDGTNAGRTASGRAYY